MAKSSEDMYTKHAMGVYRYLFSLGADADTAEELTQETFCIALKNLNSYRGDASPQTWLCGIAKRLWFKELERRGRTPTLGLDEAAHIASGSDPAQEILHKDERMRLYRAMQMLDADTREVMHLRLAGEFSFRDIGDILGKSEVWARVRFYRGKEELGRLMGGGKNE